MRFWQSTAFLPTDQLLSLASVADDAGYHGVLVSDHLVYPKDLRSRYPYSPYEDGRPVWEPETPWPDPWVLIGAMSAITTRLRFATNIYIAPARDLITVAKLVATAAVLSNDRVALGLAAGWMREEFDLTGQRYDNRGRRLNEMIPALRALWKGGWVEHRGEIYDIPPMQLSPVPTKSIPIWCGGHTEAALRRATRLCDGWISNFSREDEAAEMIAHVQELLDEYGYDARRRGPFEILMSLRARPSVDLFKRWHDRGVTGFMCAPWATTDLRPSDYPDELTFRQAAVRKFGDEVIARLG